MAAKIKHKTREAYLAAAIQKIRKLFKAAGLDDVPTCRVSCGFPRAKGGGGTAIGQAWSADCSGDKTFEIFISPALGKKDDVLATLVHECVHITVGLAAGHGPEFRKAAVALGLEGKMTSTTAGKELRKSLRTIGVSLGKYPHAALVPGETVKRNKNRHLKMSCASCDFHCRASFGAFHAFGAPEHCGAEMVMSV
jgi:hypothetical protein